MLELLQCSVSDFQVKLKELGVFKLQVLLYSVDQRDVSRIKVSPKNFELLYEKCKSMGIQTPFWLNLNNPSTSFVTNNR